MAWYADREDRASIFGNITYKTYYRAMLAASYTEVEQ